MPPDLSVEQQVAALSPKDREDLLSSMSEAEQAALAYDWQWQGRPSQIYPVDTENDPSARFSVALYMAGRGAGKTMSAAQWVRETDASWKRLHPSDGRLRFALLARTAGDVRDTMLEGPSGLLNIYPPSQRDDVRWTPTRRRVDLPGGGMCLCFSSEEPDQLRGPGFHRGWADELASYKQIRGADNLSAWDNLRFAVRLGNYPQVLATTTPKRVPVLKKILADAALDPAKTLVRKARTVDNPYLSEFYSDVILGLYQGTTMGRQELDGEMLDEVEGAMVDQNIIDTYRVEEVPPAIGFEYQRFIGVDPSVADKPRDECGIVVVYVTKTLPVLRRRAYIVDDLSLRGSPAVWGDVVVRAAHKHRATVIAEQNQGMALVKQNVNQAATHAGLPPPSYSAVWSSKAKAVRAEPVGAAWEQGRISVVNLLPELESQCTTWVAGETGYSPDRMDALVHGTVAGLFPNGLVNAAAGSGQSHSPNRLGQRLDVAHLASRDRRGRAWG